jgi:hypothetical protein
MRPLSTAELLTAWEWGLAQPYGQRALMLLAAACPDSPVDALAELSIGQRDALLFTLREWTFGSHLIGLATCPGCGEQLELGLDAADIRAETSSQVSPDQRQAATEDGTFTLVVDSYEVRFRLPNSVDLAAIAGCEDVADARHRLLTRCLQTTQPGGQDGPGDPLPADVFDAVVERMVQLDPLADVQLALTCPECGEQWQVMLDIVQFFWKEIDAWAGRVLRQVHVLASAYGWRQDDILALSPQRRQIYLDMVSGSWG